MLAFVSDSKVKSRKAAMRLPSRGGPNDAFFWIFGLEVVGQTAIIDYVAHPASGTARG